MNLEANRRIEGLQTGLGLPFMVSKSEWNRVLFVIIPEISKYHMDNEKLASGFSYSRSTTNLILCSSITSTLGEPIGLTEIENISGPNPWNGHDFPEKIQPLKERLFERTYPAWPLIVMFDLGTRFEGKKRSPAYDVWAALPK